MRLGFDIRLLYGFRPRTCTSINNMRPVSLCLFGAGQLLPALDQQDTCITDVTGSIFSSETTFEFRFILLAVRESGWGGLGFANTTTRYRAVDFWFVKTEHLVKRQWMIFFNESTGESVKGVNGFTSFRLTFVQSTAIWWEKEKVETWSSVQKWKREKERKKERERELMRARVKSTHSHDPIQKELTHFSRNTQSASAPASGKWQALKGVAYKKRDRCPAWIVFQHKRFGKKEADREDNMRQRDMEELRWRQEMVMRDT